MLFIQVVYHAVLCSNELLYVSEAYQVDNYDSIAIIGGLHQ